MEDLELLKELEKEWPGWKIDWVFDYAFDKLRNLLGINFVYLDHIGWDWDEGLEVYTIKIDYQKKLNGQKESKWFTHELFMEPKEKGMKDFDIKTGGAKFNTLRDKVILRIAWHFKNYWNGED